MPESGRTGTSSKDWAPETIAGLEALIAVGDDQDRTPLAWLREWPEAPGQKNLVGIVERLQVIRKLGIRQDREQRIHRARYATIAREIAVLGAQHLSRFDAQRRLATLVVFAREMEAILTDAGLAMFDKMLGTVCRRADQAHKEHVVDRAKTLDASTRALLGMAKAMLAAKACGEDQVAAVERALGWERLKTLVAEADKVVAMRAKTIWAKSSITIRRCAGWSRSCSARSCSAPGNSAIRCSPRSTCCAVSTRRAREICRRERRRRFLNRPGGSSSEPAAPSIAGLMKSRS